jgi:hypothetical protein
MHTSFLSPKIFGEESKHILGCALWEDAGTRRSAEAEAGKHHGATQGAALATGVVESLRVFTGFSSCPTDLAMQTTVGRNNFVGALHALR